MKEIFLLIALLGAIYAAYLIYKRLKTLPQRRGDRYYTRLCAGVHTIEEMAKQLETLDEITTSLHTCNRKHMRGVKVSVASALGRNSVYTMLADGKNYSSRQLLALAQSERLETRVKLEKAIAELYSRGKVTRYYYIDEETDEQ